MVLTVGDVVTYGAEEIGVYQKSIVHEVAELKQKVVNGTAVAEEITKLELLKE